MVCYFLLAVADTSLSFFEMRLAHLSILPRQGVIVLHVAHGFELTQLLVQLYNMVLIGFTGVGSATMFAVNAASRLFARQHNFLRWRFW